MPSHLFSILARSRRKGSGRALKSQPSLVRASLCTALRQLDRALIERAGLGGTFGPSLDVGAGGPVERVLRARDLEGESVLVTAGPTREALDPVRFLSNPSSGRMGFAMAEAARDRGAVVTLIAGPTEVAPPSGVRVVRITSADELAAAVAAHVATARVVVMAAAVSDQKPAEL